MFKNTTLFNIDTSKPYGALDGVPAFRPTTDTEELSIGFDGPGWVVIERRSVPADVLKRRTDGLAALYERAHGRKPSKAQRKELKEAAFQELLAKAFPKRKRIPIKVMGGLLAVGSTTAADVDSVTTLLAGATGIVLANLTAENVQGKLTDAVRDAELWANLYLNGSAKLTDGEETITVKAADDLADACKDALRRELRVTELRLDLALRGDQSIEFTLTDSLQFKSIELSGLVAAGDHADQESADRVLWADALRTLHGIVVGGWLA